jgi:hypothetical protein
MRGGDRSGVLNERSDGEIDERFWAQAAADQAAGLQQAEDNDESKLTLYVRRLV